MYHITVVTEIWFNAEISESKITIPDYIFLLCDRSGNRRDDEVTLIVRKILKPQSI